MAKLLIIDDQPPMVELIQRYMATINSEFTPENTFYFSSEGSDETPTLHSLGNPAEGANRNAVVHLSGKQSEIIELTLQFLSKHQKEHVLVLVDMLLCSLDINSPNAEQYYKDKEYSCDLYSELLRIQNGKDCKHNISRNRFFHIIYSRSDISLFGVICPVLKQIYDSQKEEDRKYFPLECCHPENISWCKNLCEETDEEYHVDPMQSNKDRPLALPDSYRKFIENLHEEEHDHE